MDEQSLRRELAEIERRLSELRDSERRSLEQLFEQQESSEDGLSPTPRERRGSCVALPGVICSSSFRPGELRMAAETLEAETDFQRQQYEQASLALELLLEQKRALGFDEDESEGYSSGDESDKGAGSISGGPTPARGSPENEIVVDEDIGSDAEEDFSPSLLGSRISRRTESRNNTGSGPGSGGGTTVLSPRVPMEHESMYSDDPPPPMPADSWCPAAASVHAPAEEGDNDQAEDTYNVVEWTPRQLGSANANELLTLNPTGSSRRSQGAELSSAAATVGASILFESLTASVIGGLGLVPHDAAMPTEEKAGEWAHAIAQQRSSVSVARPAAGRRGGGLAAVLARTQADDARRSAAAMRRPAKEKLSHELRKERHTKLLEQAAIQQRTEDWVLKQALPPELEPELEPEQKEELEQESQPQLQLDEVGTSSKSAQSDDGTGVGFTHRIDGSPFKPQAKLESKTSPGGDESGTHVADSSPPWEEEDEETDQENESGLRVLCVTWNLNGKIPDEDLAPLLLSDEEDRRAYDLYVIGTQESGGTIRRGLLPGRGALGAWESLLAAALGPRYTMVAAHALAATHIAVFVVPSPYNIYMALMHTRYRLCIHILIHTLH